MELTVSWFPSGVAAKNQRNLIPRAQPFLLPCGVQEKCEELKTLL